MSDVLIDAAQHGGQLGEGYGGPSCKVRILVTVLPYIWKKSVSGLIHFGP